MIYLQGKASFHLFYIFFFVWFFNWSNIDWNIDWKNGLKMVFYKTLLPWNFMHDAWKIVAVFLFTNFINYPVFVLLSNMTACIASQWFLFSIYTWVKMHNCQLRSCKHPFIEKVNTLWTVFITQQLINSQITVWLKNVKYLGLTTEFYF